MQIVVAFGNDILHPQLLEHQGDEDVVLDVVGKGHHRMIEIPHADGFEHLLIPGVGGDGMAHRVGHPVHRFFVLVHRQHFMAQAVQFPGQGHAETPQADDHKRFHLVSSFSRSSPVLRGI